MIRKGFLAVIVAVVAAGGGLYLFRNASAESPDRAALAYLAAWQRGDYPAMKKLAVSAPPEFAQIHKDLLAGLKATDFKVVPGRITESETKAEAAFRASMSLEGLGEFSYNGRLELTRREGRWFVKWSPAGVHPDLQTGLRLARSRKFPARGPILGFDDSPILDLRSAVVVGVEPRRIADRNALVAALQAHLGLDPAKVSATLDAPGIRPDHFYAVAELPEAQYEAVKPAIYPVPGLVFQRKSLRIPPSPEFARHILGTTGEITRELLDQFGRPYLPGDLIGLTGLERVYQRRLAGEPSGDVSVVNATATPVKSLRRYPGKLSEPVKISLDVPVQQAVEAVLATVAQPAAIVVLDSATGEVRASATRPVAEFNRAIGGRYPPGSTFKVVTAAAALSSGVKVTDKIDCPPEIEINGRKFRNFEGRGLGMITFADAFVNSCNTAFASIASKLSDKALIDAAGWFGFERDYSVGLRTPKAAFPEPKDDTERAAAAIGQARVQASPLHMASVAAAVASGSWKPPRVVLSPAPEQIAAIPRGPDPSVMKTLGDLMRRVVVEGTGIRANLPGAPVSGKTGTAEFGRDTPPKTHAWFIGFRGPYAFAVLIEGGGVGGEVAAPLAGALLAALPQS